MKNLKPVFSIFVVSIAFSLMGCSTNSESSKTRALFDTRAEAIKAAKDFNCTGAHRMGKQWMPCKSHDAHKDGVKHKGHHHNH